MTPKISVLLPTFNYARYLDQSIPSVLNQSFVDFELIIVDNDSTDGTEAVVQKYLTDPRVSYYRNKQNLGLVGNWNRCLDYAKGKYIKFICADDMINPAMLEIYFDVMEQFPNVSLITCYKQLFDGQPWLVELPLSHLQDGKMVILDMLGSKCWIGEPTSVMFRKSNLKYGYFRNDLTLHVDWEMWNRQLTAGDCYIIPEPLAYIRAHLAQNTHEMSYRSSIEEYLIAKLLYALPGLENDQRIIKKLVREKAAIVAKKSLYKNLPRIFTRGNKDILREAFRIASEEKVLVKGLVLLYDGIKTKFIRKFTGRRIICPAALFVGNFNLK